SRPRRREDLVDLRLAGIGSASARKRPERLRRFVRQEEVDHVGESFARVHLRPHEMASLISELCRLRSALLWMRKIRGWRFVPRRRKGPAQPRDVNDRRTATEDLDERPVVDAMEIVGQIISGTPVEVV